MLNSTNKSKMFETIAINGLFLFAAWVFNVMRMRFGYFSADYPIEDLINFTADAPFVNRVLLSLIYSPFVSYGFRLNDIFKFFDILFCFLLLRELFFIFNLLTKIKTVSVITTLAGLFVMGNIYLLDTFHSAFLYPYDIPAIFFLVLCYRFIVQQKFFSFFVAFIFATLNRESSILAVGLFFIFFHQKLPKKFFLTLLFGLLISYFTIRSSINLAIGKGDVNTMGILLKSFKHYWTVNLNVKFLLNYKNCFYLLYKMSFLPLALILLSAMKKVSPLHKEIALFLELYMATLLFCGLIYEMRCYAEVIMLLYISVAIGLFNSSQNKLIDFELPNCNTGVPVLSPLWIFFTHHAQLIIALGVSAGFLYLNY